MDRPNILFLSTDQYRWDALGVNGNAHVRTPNLDHLARDGVNCDRFFVQNPVCMPSRVSMLSGQYPSRLGIFINGIPVPETVHTLPHMLRNYGYRSANIGKLHFLPHANRDHRQTHPAYGFDHLEISDEPGCYEDAYRAWVARKAPQWLDHISCGLPPAAATWNRVMNIRNGVKHPQERFPKHGIAFRAPSELTYSSFVAEQTMEYMTQHRDGPFFCIAGFYSPHSPWIAPQEFLDLYDPDTLPVPEMPEHLQAQRKAGHYDDQELRLATQGYYAMISELDHHVGRLLKRLDELGLTENTIVLFSSDHGEFLGEFLQYGKGYPAPDCIARVPLMARWPGGGLTGGRTVSNLLEGVDVVPTLLQCAGIPVPPQVQGRSFADLLRGLDAGGRDSAMTEGFGWRALRMDRFRYIAHADGRENLFDLSVRHGQYIDIAAQPEFADALHDARRILVRRMLELDSQLPRTWQY